MRTSRWTHLLLTATTCAGLAATTGVTAFAAPVDVRIEVGRGAPNRDAYDFGYREGVARGERDARDRRVFGFDRDDVYVAGDRGYDRRWGTAQVYRVEFRRGFEAGYRDGFGRVRVVVDRRNDRRDDRWDRRVPRGFQEPASARGYSDGYDQGREDRDDRDRYDPARHKDYRSADEGYRREYGSRDAYQNNYRAGFRQGYEDGYRSGRR